MWKFSVVSQDYTLRDNSNLIHPERVIAIFSLTRGIPVVDLWKPSWDFGDACYQKPPPMEQERQPSNVPMPQPTASPVGVQPSPIPSSLAPQGTPPAGSPRPESLRVSAPVQALPVVTALPDTGYSWFYPDLSGPAAEAQLKDCIVGTFLVRESSRQGNYAITLVSDAGQITNALISRTPTGGYQLSEPGAQSYPSLGLLVESLKHILKYPFVSSERNPTLTQSSIAYGQIDEVRRMLGGEAADPQFDLFQPETSSQARSQSLYQPQRPYSPEPQPQYHHQHQVQPQPQPQPQPEPQPQPQHQTQPQVQPQPEAQHQPQPEPQPQHQPQLQPQPQPQPQPEPQQHQPQPQPQPSDRGGITAETLFFGDNPLLGKQQLEDFVHLIEAYQIESNQEYEPPAPEPVDNSDLLFKLAEGSVPLESAIFDNPLEYYHPRESQFQEPPLFGPQHTQQIVDQSSEHEASWKWQTDAGTYEPYNATVTELIEAAFQSGAPFVDFRHVGRGPNTHRIEFAFPFAQTSIRDPTKRRDVIRETQAEF
jgi:hypothetical protein